MVREQPLNDSLTKEYTKTTGHLILFWRYLFDKGVSSLVCSRFEYPTRYVMLSRDSNDQKPCRRGLYIIVSTE